MQGVKNERGAWITPAFPKLIYVLDEDNIHEDSKYWYLTELAAKCTAVSYTHLNQAADSVISHYAALAKRENIPFRAKADLPAHISIDQIDMCLVLSNLLENALEASLKAKSSNLSLIHIFKVHTANIKTVRK